MKNQKIDETGCIGIQARGLQPLGEVKYYHLNDTLYLYDS